MEKNKKGGLSKVRLKEKVVIITGSGTGIGAELVKGFAKEGAHVVVVDNKEKEAKQVADSINRDGLRAIAIHTDVSDVESVQKMVKTTMNEYNKIDVLLNNASLSVDIPLSSFYDIAEEEWDRVFAVNLKGVFLCCKEVYPIMKEQKKGKIINIHSSTVYHGGNWGKKGRLHYVASKAGVVGLTRGLARELGACGINVNSLTPGSTLTEARTKAYPQEMLDKKIKGRCIERQAEPKDLLGAAIFLASSDSDFMTGQSMVVDGGKVML